MFHLLRAEAYQIRHRRGPVLLLLVTLIISVAGGWIGMSASRELGLSVQGQAAAANTFGANLIFAYVVMLRSQPLLLSFIALVTTFNNEIKNRTMINTVSFGFRRRTVVVAKVVAALTYLALGSVVSYLGLLFGISMGGGSLQGVDLLNFFTSYLIPSLPLFAAYIALFAIPTFLFAGSGPLIFFYLFLSVLNPILIAIYGTIQASNGSRRFGLNTLDEANRFYRYVFTFLNQGTPLNFGRLNFDFMPVIALAYGAVFLFIACKLFDRAEVK